MLRRRYRLSARSHLAASGQPPWLICEHPLQALSLNPAAAALLSALDGEAWLDELVEPVPPMWTDYLDGLVERGVLRAEYRAVAPEDWPPVHIVIPVYRDADRLRRCLGSLVKLAYPPGRLTVTVVDDGSAPAPAAALGGPPLAPRWVRLEPNTGPASARNAGVASLGALSQDALLAFIDSDCEAEPDWLRELVSVLEGGDYAAVGGAVLGLRADSLLARYEDACSSLRMGERPGRVAEKDAPVPYLPACNLLVRMEAFRALGGFRAGWRTGEDVDLCWRLADSGRRIFYWPNGAVRHDHRVTWRGFLSRKRDYARSEGPLSRRHPRRFAVRPDAWAFDVALVLFGSALVLPGGFPRLALGLELAGLMLLSATDTLHLGRALVRWPWAVHPLFAGAILGAFARQAVARVLQQSRWVLRHLALPLLLVCLAMPSLWPLASGIVVAGTAGEWLSRRPALRWWQFVLGWWAECLAYSLGWLEGLILAFRRRAERAESR